MNPELSYKEKTSRWRDGESANTWGRIIRYDKNQNRVIREIMVRLSRNCRRVLDLGSGDGRVGSMLSRDVDYIGIDFSSLVDDCKVRYAESVPERVFLKHDLTEGIPSTVGKDYDLILALFVLHFFTPAGIEKLLSEARELLGPNGVLVSIGYDEYSHIERLSRKVMEQSGLVVYDIGELESSRFFGHIGRMK